MEGSYTEHELTDLAARIRRAFGPCTVAYEAMTEEEIAVDLASYPDDLRGWIDEQLEAELMDMERMGLPDAEYRAAYRDMLGRLRADPLPCPRFAPGDRVLLRANEAEGWPEERGTVDAYQTGYRVYIVTVDTGGPDNEDDADGLREVSESDMEPLPGEAAA